ncbi:hypothetical protein [uncultured Flavobacterium sp.]|mgnify:CR=1 FL=1|uniref:hypothetical protein n=1 Tax=uncultured Flavobacterium sp. TaxID=165435 RepID=UPI0025EEE99D|nr:hypothetical protein [uncultured Flavobacterium sp.]
MKQKHYTVQDLEIVNGFKEEEQIRTRKIFENLKLRASNNGKFLEREKDFLYTGLKISLLDDGKTEHFDACVDPIFKELYLTYFHNNLSEPFYKHKKGKGIVEVSEFEKLKDFKTLISISGEWYEAIKKENHKDLILQELSIEARSNLKDFETRYSPLLKKFKKGQDDYRLQKCKIILHSKFVYLLVKSIIENNNNEDFKIPFSNEVVEFTLYSLVHIVNRHYAEQIKNNPNKTYHYENFYPKELHVDLKNILIKIDEFELINLDKTDNVIFKSNNVVYKLYIHKRYKQVKGQGNVKIYRIQTFYPIYSNIEKQKISEHYREVSVDGDLSFFVIK